MKTSRSLASIAAILAASTMLTGCDAVIDCLDGDGPVFRTDSLVNAVLNQEYIDRVRVSIENEPFDSRFDYDFDIISGSLPPGISGERIGQNYQLMGTATELGRFEFRLNVEVDDGLSANESGLCYRTREKNYTILVVQDNR